MDSKKLVRIASITWFCIGVMMAFSGLGAALISAIQRRSGVLVDIYDYFIIGGLSQAVLAGFLAFCGFMLGKQKNWARLFLIAASYLLTFFGLVFQIAPIIFIFTIIPNGESGSILLKVLISLLIVFSMIPFQVIAILMIKFMTSATFKSEFL